jgi:hypothetical protein
MSDGPQVSLVVFGQETHVFFLKDHQTTNVCDKNQSLNKLERFIFEYESAYRKLRIQYNDRIYSKGFICI